MARRRPALSAQVAAKVDRLARLVAEHASRLSRDGRLASCRCDLCRQALKQLARLKRAHGISR